MCRPTASIPVRYTAPAANKVHGGRSVPPWSVRVSARRLISTALERAMGGTRGCRMGPRLGVRRTKPRLGLATPGRGCISTREGVDLDFCLGARSLCPIARPAPVVSYGNDPEAIRLKIVDQ